MGTTLRARRPPVPPRPAPRALTAPRPAPGPPPARGQNLMLLIIPATLVVRSEMVGATDELAM